MAIVLALTSSVAFGDVPLGESTRGRAWWNKNPALTVNADLGGQPERTDADTGSDEAKELVDSRRGVVLGYAGRF